MNWTALTVKMQFSDVVQELLRNLASTTQVTAHFAVLDHNQVIYVRAL